VTKYNDIMDIETNHSVFSSAASLGGITIRDPSPDLRRESFIAMDQPRHSAQRNADCNGRRAERQAELLVPR
jgi:cytochrome P450